MNVKAVDPRLGTSGPADLFAQEMRFAPYWWDALTTAQSDIPPLAADADVIVVGGGFTGMSAARTLAQAGRRVAVLEAGRPGVGASTRNGGMFGPATNVFETALGEYGVEMAKRIVDDSEKAYAFLKDLIATEQIDCKMAVTGHFRGAMQPRIYERMARSLDAVRRHVPYDAYMVPRSEQQREVGTDLYHGGIVNPRHAGLHPGLFHEGLWRAACQAGATVWRETPVLQITRDGTGFIVKTPRGTMRARHVLIATNAYTGAFSPALQRRVIPIRSAVIATEILPEATMARLIPTQRMLGGSQRIATYYRASPDGRRILFGGRVLRLRSRDDQDVDVQKVNARYLHSLMCRVFPELSQTKLTHYGQGQTAFTFDHLPHIGEMDGVHYALGYCGSGVSRASWLGHQAAQRILGGPAGASPFEMLSLRTRPLYYGRPWFLPLAVKVYDMRDRWDQRQQR